MSSTSAPFDKIKNGKKTIEILCNHSFYQIYQRQHSPSSRFARHSNPSTTMRYITKGKEELYKDIDFAFTDKITPLKRLFNSLKNQ